MFNSAVIDIAIGLAFLYLLLGLIVTTINELIESYLRKRAKDLEAGICEMFGGSDTVKEAKKKAEAESQTYFPLPADAKAVQKIVEEFVLWAERKALADLKLPTTEKEAKDFVMDAKKVAEAKARASLALPDAEKAAFVEATRKEYIAAAVEKAETVAAGIKRLYDHPLIFSLFDGNYEAAGHKLPSYIPSRNFALALLDLVKPADAKPTAKPAEGTPTPRTYSRTCPARRRRLRTDSEPAGRGECSIDSCSFDVRHRGYGRCGAHQDGARECQPARAGAEGVTRPRRCGRERHEPGAGEH